MRRMLILIAALAGGCGAARAAACAVSVTPVMFGGYSPLSATALTSTGKVTVTCDGAGAYGVALNAGVNSGGSFAARRMRNGGSLLGYQLYSDGGRTIVWGDGSGGSTTVAGSGSATLTIYGRIPAGQNVAAGSFSDTVLVTITY